jgi:hypothetical protein
MHKLKVLLIAVIAIHLLNSHVYAWSPWNLLFGPQYDANSKSKELTEYEQKMSGFINHDLPKLYPTLIEYLGEDNAFRIFYKTQFCQDEYIDISNNKNDGVVIRTTMELNSANG